jgi:hypothetical protein
MSAITFLGHCLATFKLDASLCDLALSADASVLVLGIAGLDDRASIRCCRPTTGEVICEAVRPLVVVGVALDGGGGVVSLRNAETEYRVTLDDLTLRNPRECARFPATAAFRRMTFDSSSGRAALQGKSLLIGTPGFGEFSQCATAAGNALFVSCAFAADGRIITCGDVPGYAALRDADGSGEHARWQAPGGRNWIPLLSPAGDALLLYADGGSGSLLYDTATGARLCPEFFHETAFNFAPTFSPDGAWLLALGEIGAFACAIRESRPSLTRLSQDQQFVPIATAWAAKANVVAFGWEREVRVHEISTTRTG